MKTQNNGLNTSSSSETKVVNEFPIVAIGASAGGLDPIRKLLETVPIDTGMAFIIIQHLASGQESMLPEILSRSTKMTVRQVKDGMKVQKNQVYVITPATTMTLKKGLLKLVPKGVALKPINDFMVSLASERKSQAIGIVLSGTGNDGTEGLKAIKTEGGITFAQDPETAQYSDMPRNAIAAESLDFILAPKQIADELGRLAKHPQLIRSQKKQQQEKVEVEPELKKIMVLLRNSFGVDFTHYRETTINRRITRRMVINKTPNIKLYAEFLRSQPNEQQALFDDLLIGVTSFFREPETFLLLTEKIFPELIQNRSPKEAIRVWVPGCSTGEDVYSFSIAIQEFLEENNLLELRVQIFGTDANEKNIEKARQGIYPKSIEDNVSENRLKRFFTAYNGHYRIGKQIRDKCIFAKQDITTDPPFSNIDIVMCRNVLIYFDAYLHERILPVFHYGLKPNGFLVLGESESVGKFQYLFESIVPKGLIYRKKQAQPQPRINEETFMPMVAKNSIIQPLKADLMSVLSQKVDHLITSEYGPAILLVNNNLEILVFRGDVAAYLSPESGAASFNVTKIVRKELRSQVQTALYRAKKENRIIKETVDYKHKGQSKTVGIEIKPIKTAEYEEPFYLVIFCETTTSPNTPLKRQEAELAISPSEMETLKERQIRELREDLETTKQSLQTLVEGQEATNEELRSAMEEVQSSNEELQSTNEELETAKEELQSGNEELQTLNEELKNRNLALGRLNDDLANLQANIDLPVVIVDNDLKIRRFTSSAESYLKISPSDVGQSITKVNIGIQGANLENIITDVITKLTAVNREVALSGDRLCEIKVRPYLSEEKKIDGAVLTFTDITERKKIESALRDSELRYRTLFANMDEAFFLGEPILDSKGNPVDFRIIEANGAFEKQTGLKLVDLMGKTLKEALPGLEESWIQRYCKVALTGQPIHFEEYNGNTKRYYEVYSFSPTNGQFASLFTDITKRKKMEQKLTDSLKESRQSESEVSALLKASRAVLQNKEFQGSARAIFDVCKGLIGAVAGYVALLSKDGKGNDLLFLDSGGLPCTVNPSLPMPIRGLRAEAYRSGKVVFENNFPRSEWQKFAPERHLQLENVLFAPLTIEQRVVGVIGLANKPGGFIKRDSEMAKAFGELAAVALTNSQMLEKLEENEKELKAHSENLKNLVEERTKQLRDSERLAAIGTTAGMVGHDIRNPLQAITSDVYLATTELALTPESEEKKNALCSLKEIEKNIDYINKIVQDLQDFAKPLSPRAEETDLKLLVDELIAKNGLPENVKISVKVETEARKIVADSSFINRIMYNLVNNAVQAMPNGGKLTIHAFIDKKKLDSVITVEDTGVGIPDSVKNKLFTPMFTTKAKGQGFGLAVIRRMTEALGGTATFESQEGKGTKFIIRLPPPMELNGKWTYK